MPLGVVRSLEFSARTSRKVSRRRVAEQGDLLQIAPQWRTLLIMRVHTHQVWFVVFPGSELLDVSGPWSVFGYANEVAGRDAYACKLVSPAGGAVRTRHGIALGGALSLTDAARRGLPNTLVIAGATPANGRSEVEMRFSRWLREKSRGIQRIVSVCTGAFVLGEANLLNRKRATTHWLYRDELQQRFPRAHVGGDDLFVHDGRIWTSAGITAGIDLMLAIVEEDLGHSVAITAAKTLVAYLRRSGPQALFSQSIPGLRDPGNAHSLSTLIVSHLDEALSVRELARLAGMSPRTLGRLCAKELGETPSSLVRRLRLEEVQRLLAHTSLPLKAIATRTGIGDATTLWRLFRRRFGATPAEYRKRFTATALLRLAKDDI